MRAVEIVVDFRHNTAEKYCGCLGYGRGGVSEPVHLCVGTTLGTGCARMYTITVQIAPGDMTPP